MPRSRYSNTVSSTYTRPEIRRIGRLTLENFRAFRGVHQFDFEGQNVLVYGENGSGKTSIWAALDAFMSAVLAKDEKASRQSFGRQRYQFNRAAAEVRIEFIGTKGEKFRDVVWSREDSPRSYDELIGPARVSARLDYRAMWETYFLHRKDSQVNVWPLLIEALIPHLTMVSGPTVGDGWAQLLHWYRTEEKDWDVDYWVPREMLSLFAAELKEILEQVSEEAHRILNVLVPGLSFQWDYREPRLTRFPGKIVRLYHPRVILTASIGGQNLRRHHNLLNEARLSALALSIYLGAAKINASQSFSQLRILALDDVLIGLDMSNRMPVLDVLEHWFADWQIFLFTYDRAWYELAKSRLDKDKWKKFEFFASDDVPVWNEDLDSLNKAEFYLKTARDLAGLSEPVRVTPDYRAAGVYARTAFEMALKRFFHKHEVPVVYQLEPKHMLGDLWPVMEKLHSTVGEDRGPVLNAQLCRDIETYTKNSLNPLCHSGFFQYDRREVLGAVAAVGQLQDELAKAHKKVGVPVFAPATKPQSGSLGFDLRTIDLSDLDRSELIRFKDNIAGELRSRPKE